MVPINLTLTMGRYSSEQNIASGLMVVIAIRGC